LEGKAHYRLEPAWTDMGKRFIINNNTRPDTATAVGIPKKVIQSVFSAIQPDKKEQESDICTYSSLNSKH
jgi:hypothetical protein